MTTKKKTTKAARVTTKGRQFDPPATKVSSVGRPKKDAARDSRIPKSGTLLTRKWKGRDHAVKVLKDGFEYKGDQYGSLSKIANMITRGSWNGYVFFGLTAANKKAAA